MTLYIDTTLKDKIFLTLLRSKKAKTLLNKNTSSFEIINLKEILTYRNQAEKLLPNIEKLLKVSKLEPRHLKQIIVNNYGGSFTSLRVGVINANALAFALKIPVLAGNLEKLSGNNILETGKKDLTLNLDKFKKLEIIKIKKLPGGKKFANYFLVEPFYNAEPNIGQKKAC